MGLVSFINGRFEKSFEKQNERRQVLVTRGARYENRLMRMSYIRMILLLVIILVGIWVPWNWVSDACFGLIGMFYISMADRPEYGARSYRAGWIDGRLRFITNVKQHRGDLNAWLKTEAEHDWVIVFGESLETSPMRHLE